MAFKDLLSPEMRRRLESRQKYRDKQIMALLNMSDEKFADHAEYCLKNTQLIQRQYTDQDPVYDASLVYYIVPELIRRLRERRLLTPNP